MIPNSPKTCVPVARWIGLVTYTYLLIILHLFHPQSQHQSSHKKSTYDSDIWRARGCPTKPRSQTHKPSPAPTTDKYRQFVSTVVILVFRFASAIFIRTAAVILVFQSTAIFISTAVISVFLLSNAFSTLSNPTTTRIIQVCSAIQLLKFRIVAMVGGAGLHNWLTLFVVVSSAKDSMHARFHMWGVCGHAWCHLCHPLATRAGPAKPRMGSQKSKQKSPRTVSRHPPVYLSHTSNFHHNRCCLGTFGKKRSRCAFAIWPVAFCTSSCEPDCWGGWAKENCGANKEWAVVGQKAEIFLRRGIGQSGQHQAIVAQEREAAIRISIFQLSFDGELGGQNWWESRIH